MTRKQTHDQQFSLDLDGTAVPETRPLPETVPHEPTPDAATLLQDPDGMDQLLFRWQEAQWIRPLDREFARLIRTLCEEQEEQPTPLLILLAALCSHQVGRGHVCVDLQGLLEAPARTLALPPDDAGTG
ncbi:MAG: exodeoxyribonuclease V subunit alpha, partial [Marinobacter sp.]